MNYLYINILHFFKIQILISHQSRCKECALPLSWKLGSKASFFCFLSCLIRPSMLSSLLFIYLYATWLWENFWSIPISTCDKFSIYLVFFDFFFNIRSFSSIFSRCKLISLFFIKDLIFSWDFISFVATISLFFCFSCKLFSFSLIIYFSCFYDYFCTFSLF